MSGDEGAIDMTGRSIADWGFVDGLGLAIARNGIDSPAWVIDVMDIRPLGDLDVLGLTPVEAKQILTRLQQAVVAVQADDHAILRPDCCSHLERGLASRHHPLSDSIPADLHAEQGPPVRRSL
jgi:hypothetical protein